MCFLIIFSIEKDFLFVASCLWEFAASYYWKLDRWIVYIHVFVWIGEYCLGFWVIVSNTLYSIFFLVPTCECFSYLEAIIFRDLQNSNSLASAEPESTDDSRCCITRGVIKVMSPTVQRLQLFFLRNNRAQVSLRLYSDHTLHTHLII